MTRSLRLSLKSGERIYINGAVLRPDRKVSLELMNDATFLLAHHVIQPEDVTSPLRQLGFLVQSVLIAPTNANAALTAICHVISELRISETEQEVLDRLDQISGYLDANRPFEAFKLVRRLILRREIEVDLHSNKVREPCK
jgi:flagellar biosynthesis repressor protein FlbT